jgi:hypothetical protein
LKGDSIERKIIINLKKIKIKMATNHSWRFRSYFPNGKKKSSLELKGERLQRNLIWNWVTLYTKPVMCNCQTTKASEFTKHLCFEHWKSVETEPGHVAASSAPVKDNYRVMFLWKSAILKRCNTATFKFFQIPFQV